VVFICLSCLYDVNATDGEFASAATLPRRPAPPLSGSTDRAAATKKSPNRTGVNDCAGFLHTLTTGFNNHAPVVRF